MSFVVNAIQSYNNIIQSYDAVSSTQNNNETSIDRIQSLDMSAIAEAGPTNSTVMALSQADKITVLQNADNGLKYQCIQAWQESLDKQTKKEIAEDFNVFGDLDS